MVALFDFLKKKSKPKPEKKKKVRTTLEKELVKKMPARKKDLGEVYKILKEPHISEKATHLSDGRKYTFKVYSNTNKVEIAKAIGNLYGVKIKDVNIINIKSKKRTLRGLEGIKPGYKKAIITLEQGEKIEIMPH